MRDPTPRSMSSRTRVEAAGTPPKLIDEYVGRVNSEHGPR